MTQKGLFERHQTGIPRESSITCGGKKIVANRRQSSPGLARYAGVQGSIDQARIEHSSTITNDYHSESTDIESRRARRPDQRARRAGEHEARSEITESQRARRLKEPRRPKENTMAHHTTTNEQRLTVLLNAEKLFSQWQFSII